MPTPFSTASSTTPNGSTCQATACGEPEQNQSSRVDRTHRSVQHITSQLGSAPSTTSCRNTRRHQIGMPGRLHRNRQLTRTWRGIVHHVDVLEGGFEYRGERFGSLSKIARRITGTRWSGPLFFGLKDVSP